jgi:aminocarboxymuconate-semialdehyde decarboxylase
LNQEQYDAIWSDNVLQWLFGNDQAQKDVLIKKILG